MTEVDGAAAEALRSAPPAVQQKVIQRGSLPSDAKNPSSMLFHRIRDYASKWAAAQAAAPQSAPGVLPALAAHSILKWGENGSQALLVPLQCVRMVLTVEH